jgi:uncharacterized membrane protein
MVIIAATISGLVLRIYRLTFVTLWYDEYLTLNTIQLPWKQVLLGNYQRELNPPLYFLVLKLWTTLIGESELSIRMLSIGISMVSIVLAILIVRKLGADWRVQLGISVILAFHPLYLYFSTEVRMYSLLILFSLLSFYTYLAYNTNPKKNLYLLALLLISASATLFTHYSGILILLGITIFASARIIRLADHSQLNVLIILILSLMIFLASAQIFLPDQIQEYLNYYRNTPGGLYNSLNLYLIPGMFSGSGILVSDSFHWSHLFTLFAVIAGTMMLLTHNNGTTAISLIIFILISAILLFALNKIGVNVASRYLIHVNLFVLILASFSLLNSSQKYSIVLNLAGATALFIFISAGLYSTIRQEYHAPNWRNIAELIEMESKPNEPYVILGRDAMPITYYLSDHTGLTAYEFTNELGNGSKRDSYLLIDSEYNQAMPFSENTEVVLNLQNGKIQLIRYFVQ